MTPRIVSRMGCVVMLEAHSGVVGMTLARTEHPSEINLAGIAEIGTLQALCATKECR